MEDYDEDEVLGIDTTFDVHALIYQVLKETISTSIDAENDKQLEKSVPVQMVIPKEKMLENILAYNLAHLEEECFLTTGAFGKIFLCGPWLMRPVLSDGKMIPMMEHLKLCLSFDDVVFIPGKTGTQFRQSHWTPQNDHCSSYDVPKSCKIDGFKDIQPPPGMMGPPKGMPPAGGPPPGMGPAGPMMSMNKKMDDLLLEMTDDDDVEELLEPLEELPEEIEPISETQKQMIDQLVDSVLEE